MKFSLCCGMLYVGLLFLTAGILGQPTTASAAETRRPNVVLIIPDDQGYGDVGFHGNSMIQTPNLDALAKQSVRMTNFHVDPTCSETRSALMTGRYSSRVGVWHTIMGRSLLRKDEVTIADVFAKNGYRTGIFGKWHLGDNYPFRPQDRGFQEVLVHGGGGVGQTPDFWGNDYFDDTYFRNGKPEKQSGYCTDVWFREATKFIESNKDRPFFCYLSTNAPHGPFHVAEKYSKPYLGKAVPQPMANFYGMITNIDENVGRLLKKIDSLDLAENTVVIFMTDNGTAAGVQRRGKPKPGQWAGFNAGMRGQKGTQYDGGHRVPCFIRWPGKIGKPRDEDFLAAHIDILPSLIDLCGLHDKPNVAFDGKSWSGFLHNGEKRGSPARTLFAHSQRVDHPEKWRKSSVMTDTWRLVDGKQLFAIRTDPAQAKDVADLHLEVVEKLRGEYEKWWESISTRFDEYCEIALGAPEQNPTGLTCHDWHAGNVPWNQGHIRGDLKSNGYWAVEVLQDGKYEFTLRARPKDVKYSLRSGNARIKIGGVESAVDIPQGASAVSVTLELKAGKTRLQTWLAEKQRGQRGAYYVEVKRLD